MQHLNIGDKVPVATFRTRVESDWLDISTDVLFKDKRVVVFALPGAFTPTCSSSHLPRYNALAPTFKSLGVDELICLSVNDAFVMDAWAADQKAENIRFIPDGNGEFSRGMGMLVDKTDLGFGERSWRYSMLVVDGVIEKLFVEPDLPGDPFEVSDADTMLNSLDAQARPPKNVTLFTKPGCIHCKRAKQVLADAGYQFDVMEVGVNGLSFNSVFAVSGAMTVPQIFIDGELIGGATELDSWLVSKP